MVKMNMIFVILTVQRIGSTHWFLYCDIFKHFLSKYCNLRPLNNVQFYF